jgi:hypothetical protein
MGKCTTVTMEEIDGAIVTTSTVQAGGFVASTGAAGITDSEAAVNTFAITIVNGLITAFSKTT